VETQGRGADILLSKPGASVREGTKTVDGLELLQASAWIYCLLPPISLPRLNRWKQNSIYTTTNKTGIDGRNETSQYGD